MGWLTADCCLQYNKEFADGVWPPASTLAAPQRVSQPESTQSAGAASSPAEEAETGRAGTAAPSTLAGSFWTSTVNVETPSATLIEFDSIQESQGAPASLETPDPTVQVRKVSPSCCDWTRQDL
jgi:hypothetical protein